MPPFLRNTINFFKKHLYLSFSLLFFVLILSVVLHYYLNGRTLVWSGDGLAQHYPAYVYYGKYLREIVGNLFSGNGLVIPEWNFALGEGADILTTLHYYCIGDPFAFFTILIPVDFTWIYYDFSIILRLYLAGIVFIKFAKKLGVKNKYALLSGALSYSFCGWAMSKLCRHIFFLNPLIYLPLLLLGVEKILKKEKPYLFIFAVMISALSNIYFLWMLAIFTLIYVIVRLVTSKEQGRIKTFLKISAFALLGLGLSAVILLPMAHTFLGNSRFTTRSPFYLLYPNSYYLLLLPEYFIGVSATAKGLFSTSIPAFLSCLLLYRHRKKYKTLFVFHLILLPPLLIPAFAQILNGLSYVSNRWSWAYALLSCATLALIWNTLVHFIKNRSPLKNEIQPLLLVLTFFNLLVFCCLYHNLDRKDIVNRGTEISELSPEALEGSASAVRTISTKESLSSEDFFRFYSLDDPSGNTGFTANISSPNTFWSIINPNIVNYRKTLGLQDITAFKIDDGYQFHADLDALSGIRYFTKEHDNPSAPPYGFTYVDTIKNSALDKQYDIYSNDFTLPLGVTYKNTISSTDFKTLTTAQKTETLLNAIVTDDEPNSSLKDLNFSSQKIPFTISTADGAEITDGKIITTTKESQVTLHFDSPKASETILTINNLSVKPQNLNPGEGTVSPHEKDAFPILIPTKNNPDAILLYSTPSTIGYRSSNEASSLNLGYHDEPFTSITLTFFSPGEYSFDELYLEARSYKKFSSQIKNLKKDAMYNTKLLTNKITGEINLNEGKTLLLTIPYSAGWTAFVDEEETKIEKADIGYMAIALSSGHHDLKLIYKTPLKREGLLISLASILILSAYIILSKRYS